MEKWLKEAKDEYGTGQGNHLRVIKKIQETLKTNKLIDNQGPTNTTELTHLLKKGGGMALRNSLINLAKDRLPKIMDNSYTKHVVECLRCLEPEGGFGHGGKFETMKHSDACDIFSNAVVAPLRQMNRGVLV